MKRLTLTALLLFSFFQTNASETPHRVLLVYESSRFKTNLISKMEELFTQKNIEVTVSTHSRRDMGIDNPHNYSAIFISNSGVNSQIRPWISKWLEQTDYQNILLHTTQISEWSIDTEFDAVTSASSNSQINEIAAEYTEKITELFLQTENSEHEKNDKNQPSENNELN
ncbi:hypothetical protein CHISP_0333 [Chitinispirillum alkaliphilum]|nr:hypothetical protein CHISP_0333 [Chitinispirillum alkaliphilum]